MKKLSLILITILFMGLTACQSDVIEENADIPVANINCGDFPRGETKGDETFYVCQDTQSTQCLLRRNYQDEGTEWSAFYDFDGNALDAAEAVEFDDAPVNCFSTTQNFFESVVQ